MEAALDIGDCCCGGIPASVLPAARLSTSDIVAARLAMSANLEAILSDDDQGGGADCKQRPEYFCAAVDVGADQAVPGPCADLVRAPWPGVLGAF